MGYKLDDANFINELVKIIKEIVKEEIKNAPFDRSEYAKVVSVPAGGLCDIKLKNEGTTIEDVKINDGLTIANGDDVYITRIQNSKSSYLITMKK